MEIDTISAAEQIQAHKKHLGELQLQLGKFSDRLDSMINTPDDQLLHVYAQGTQDMVNQGMLSPGQFPPAADVQAQGEVGELRKFLQANMERAASAKELAEQQQLDMDYVLKLLRFHEEAVKDGPGDDTKWRRQADRVLSSASTPSQWQLGLQSLRQQGVPEAILSQFDGLFHFCSSGN